jgi:hypothetical protein
MERGEEEEMEEVEKGQQLQQLALVAPPLVAVALGASEWMMIMRRRRQLQQQLLLFLWLCRGQESERAGRGAAARLLRLPPLLLRLCLQQALDSCSSLPSPGLTLWPCLVGSPSVPELLCSQGLLGRAPAALPGSTLLCRQLLWQCRTAL